MSIDSSVNYPLARMVFAHSINIERVSFALANAGSFVSQV